MIKTMNDMHPKWKLEQSQSTFLRKDDSGERLIAVSLLSLSTLIYRTIHDLAKCKSEYEGKVDLLLGDVALGNILPYYLLTFNCWNSS